MSLATRCAACGTVFRVVQDQLKVSEGWVRCGRCGDVFNALEGLFDLERESAPSWTPSQRGALDLLPASASEHGALREAQAAIAAAAVGRSDSVADEGAPPGDAAEDTQLDTRADSHLETRLLDRDELDDDAVGRGEASEFDDATADAAANASAAPEPTPGFLRQAELAARWHSPRMRFALRAAAGLLAVALALQATLWQRDAIAARWPQSTPLLAGLCEPLGCRIETLRHLDGLAVESSGLTQLEGSALYRLQVALRNRDSRPLMTPALDVTLTDSRGDVVARKVLGQKDFGAAPATMAAGAELSLQVVLDSGERRISGYSIEIFYP
jgi:predicted Zn finger-like uncharacterized protein